ncbi:cytochrome b [Pseudomonas sp. QE6]|uniref:cytochrome b n=1 Tax=Pseudomonas sp. QE6 TaxID=3242491 RepID=UPI0035275390
MKQPVGFYHPILRLLHGAMAILLIGMLFVGVAMVASLASYQPQLVSWHKQIGLPLLLLAVMRLLVRCATAKPPLPSTVGVWQRRLAGLMHLALYALLLVQPVVGWAMQSAADYPLRLAGWVVPSLVGQDASLYGLLRSVHGWLGLSLFALILLHAAAALVHGLIHRDGVFSRMWRVR